MELVIRVDLGNEAMQTGWDVHQAVAQAFGGSTPLAVGDEGDMRDENGNTVGTWHVMRRNGNE